jgi:tRNA A-37 threonylcarbamoyl transferase component Bud32
MESGERAGNDAVGLPAPGSLPRALGRYRIVAELGRGSTSIVYLGILRGPQRFNKLLALKRLRAEFARNQASVAMFLAEARLGARLSHPNVVSTLEIEEREDQPYIVMEYLDGQPLQQVVTGARVAFAPLPLHLQLAAISGGLEGLGYAHAAVGFDGAPLLVVHRDVSPHNIFVTVDGVVKLLDFGVAQAADSASAMPTSAGHVGYMSPEQAAGEPVDFRSDLFAIGVMLWEAVTRKRFWPETSDKAQIVQALAARELPASRIGALANSPVELKSIIVKATAPDRDDRYESAAALQEDLRAILQRITPPNAGSHDLGRRVLTIFAGERARLRAALDAALESDDDGVAATSEGSAVADTTAVEPARPMPAAPPAAAPTPDTVATIPRPLPAFALPVVPGPRTWALRSRGPAVAAVGLALVAGVVLSRLPVRSDGSKEETHPSRAAAPSVPSESAPVDTALSVRTEDPSTENHAAESVSAIAQSEPDERRDSIAPNLRPAKPPSALGRRAAVTAHVVESPNARPSYAPGLGGGDSVRVSENHPTPTPPSRPIDSNNPYDR